MLSTKPLPASTNEKHNEQLLNSALFLAREGFHVFPVHSKKDNGSCSCNNSQCKSIGKHPRTLNGLKDATIDPTLIKSWWLGSFKGCNIAIATGAISGFFAVDIDVKHDGIRAWETYKDDHHFDDYETVSQETPSGGKHVFYKMPSEGKVVTKTNVLAQGIDIRGDGGYIVAAPSTGYEFINDQAIGNCPIKEAPEVLINQVIKMINKPKADNTYFLPNVCLYDLGKDETNKIKHALQYVEPDDYSHWWSIGAALHSTNGTEAFNWWCAWAQESSKFVHEEHVKAWNDFDIRHGNTDTVIFIDYLYRLAGENGWVETFDHSDCFFDPNITNEEFQMMALKTAKDKETPYFSDVLAIRTFNNSFNPAQIPKRNWLIQGYILAGYINLLVSPGAVGKSTFTIIEAISIATGKDLLGLGNIKQGNVLLINNEDDDNEIDRRIAAICEYYRIEIDDLKDTLFVHSGYGEGFVIADEVDRKVVPSLLSQVLVTRIKEKNIALLTVDPFVSTHGSNENDNSSIDSVIKCYKAIAGLTGVAIRLVHHTRKSGGEADSHAGDVESARGASSLKDAARVCHTLSGMGEIAAKNAEIEPIVRHRLVRIDDAKTNFSLSTGTAKWFYKESVQIANGEWLGVMRPYNLEVTNKVEKPTRESIKAKVILDTGRAALIKLGKEGGKVKGTELRAEYMNLVNCGKTTASDNFSLLPNGSSKSERINIHGNYFRIFQTKGERSTSPRYIHLQPDE